MKYLLITLILFSCNRKTLQMEKDTSPGARNYTINERYYCCSHCDQKVLDSVNMLYYGGYWHFRSHDQYVKYGSYIQDMDMVIIQNDTSMVFKIY